MERNRFPNKLFYHISKDILDEIIDTGDPEKIAAKVFQFMQTDAMYWSQTGEFPSPIPVDRFNKGFANPAFEKTKSYLARFGYLTYRDDMNRLLKAQATPVINMLNHLVDTRNNIAHGDPTATKTPQEVKDMMNLIAVYCRSTDNVFANWCRTNYCPIRI